MIPATGSSLSRACDLLQGEVPGPLALSQGQFDGLLCFFLVNSFPSSSNAYVQVDVLAEIVKLNRSFDTLILHLDAVSYTVQGMQVVEQVAGDMYTHAQIVQQVENQQP